MLIVYSTQSTSIGNKHRFRKRYILNNDWAPKQDDRLQTAWKQKCIFPVRDSNNSDVASGCDALV